MWGRAVEVLLRRPPLSQEASRQPPSSARTMSGALTKRLDTCVYPTPRIVHSSSRSPQTNCGCTGLQQGCPARPGCTRALAAQGSPPRAPAGHVPRRGRDPRPDTRKTPSKKLAATRTRPPQGSVEPAREAHGLEWAAWGGGENCPVRCQVGAGWHRWVVWAQVESGGRKWDLGTRGRD